MIFHGLEIETCDGVYEPAEDSFLLADSLRGMEYKDVIEIGPGTGLLALICAQRARHVVAVDISKEAAVCTNNNAKRNNVENIEVIRGDLFFPISESHSFDLVIFNPPYLPEDDGDKAASSAWSGGKDGRLVIDRFLEQTKNYLKSGGRMLTIGSSHSAYEKTIEVLEASGFKTKILARKKFFFEEIVLIEAIHL